MEDYWSPQSDSKNEKSLIVGSTNSIHLRVLVIRLASWVPCTQLQKHRNFYLFCRPGGSDIDTIPFSQDTADMWTNSSCCRYRTEWFCNISNTCYNTVRSGGRWVNIRKKYIYYNNKLLYKTWRLIYCYHDTDSDKSNSVLLLQSTRTFHLFQKLGDLE